MARLALEMGMEKDVPEKIFRMFLLEHVRG